VSKPNVATLHYYSSKLVVATSELAISFTTIPVTTAYCSCLALTHYSIGY